MNVSVYGSVLYLFCCSLNLVFELLIHCLFVRLIISKVVITASIYSFAIFYYYFWLILFCKSARENGINNSWSIGWSGRNECECDDVYWRIKGCLKMARPMFPVEWDQMYGVFTWIPLYSMYMLVLNSWRYIVFIYGLFSFWDKVCNG